MATTGEPGLALAPAAPDALRDVPQFPPGMVRRDELLERIERSAAARDCLTVALLTAPPGFGKTTVAAQWATARRDRGDLVAWVRCNVSEGDERALVGLVVDAVAQAFAARGDTRGTSSRLRELAVPTSDGIASFGGAVAELLEPTGTPVAVVLDDLHHVRHEQTIRDLGRLLTCLPPSVTVLATSRVDDPVLNTQLRLRTHLVHLGADDLAFGPQHLQQLVAASHPHDAATVVYDVRRFTAGWPAAARLALLPSSAATTPTAPLSPLDADAVHDFIWTEVALGLSDDDRQLLLDTCVVGQMNVALAHALSGRVDAGARLERLFRSQALLTRTGTDDPWYTVHSLLRTSLLTELRRRDLQAPARQHATAATWLAEHGYTHLALEHAVAAGDAARTSALLLDGGLALLAGGYGQRVQQALASVPPGERGLPLQALALVAQLDAGHVPPTLSWAWQQPDEPAGLSQGVPALPRLAALYWYRVHGGATTDGLRRYFPDLASWRVASKVADGDLDAALLLLTQRGRLAYMLGDSDAAEADLTRAVELAQPARRDLVVLRCLGTRAIILAERGEHAATLAFVAEQLATVEARGWRTHPAVTGFYAVAAWAAHHMLQPQREREYADLAAESAAQSADPEYTIAAQIVQAVLTIDRPAERAEGIQALARVVALPQHSLGVHMRAFAAYSGIRLRLAHGDIRGAAEALDQLMSVAPGAGDHAPVRALLLLRRQPADARRLVQPVIAGEVPLEMRNSRTWALVVDALAAQRLGDAPGSERSMVAAIEDAAPRGAARPFYDLGPEALELMRRARVDQSTRTFVEQTLARAAQVDDLRRSRVPTSSVGPRLTRREREVLRDLPTLLTAEEIAVQQGVSVNTVRTHMRTLYRKLGASNRREAVRTAQRTGLLG